MLDYVLYGAQTEISRMYMHHGTGWRYSAWNPVNAWGYPSGVLGTYFSYLFSHTALAGGNKQVELLVESNTFVAYGIYDKRRTHHGSGARLESVAALHLRSWNSTFTGERPSIDLKIPSQLIQKSTKVTRLTGPGTDLRWGITFGGHGVALDGTLNGTAKLENVLNGKVTIQAAEAVLITF
jgi:hypothetical protein